MSNKPIFVATHPRACSTAFERVFMTRRDTLQCVHEPFGDAYYYGPERLGARYEKNEKARAASGFGGSTYKTIFDRIDRENTEDKRIFIKDMAQYFIPPNHDPVALAPSLCSKKRGVGTQATSAAHFATSVPPAANAVPVKPKEEAKNGEKTSPPYPYPTCFEPGNPTVVPEALLRQFHFTFLIRHPRNSIPSYYRCTIPPLDDITGFFNYMPEEAGYVELVRMFNFLKGVKQVGPEVCGRESPTGDTNGATSNGATNGVTANGNANGIANGHTNGETNGTTTNGDKPQDEVEICVIDADDLLDHPAQVIEAYCNSVGIPYEPDMLQWGTEEHHKYAKEQFEKWMGFHDDAIASTELKQRCHRDTRSDEEMYESWVKKYGNDGAEIIKKSVEENVPHYEYLKQFALKV